MNFTLDILSPPFEVSISQGGTQRDMQIVTVIAIVSIALNIVLLIWGMVQKIGLHALVQFMKDKQIEVEHNEVHKATEKVLKKRVQKES